MHDSWRNKMKSRIRFVLLFACVLSISGCATRQTTTSQLEGGWSEWALSDHGDKKAQSELELAMDELSKGQLDHAEQMLKTLSKSEPAAAVFYAESAVIKASFSEAVRRYVSFIKAYPESSLMPFAVARLNHLLGVSYVNADWDEISGLRVKDDYSQALLVALQSSVMRRQVGFSALSVPRTIPLTRWKWIGPVDTRSFSGFEREQIFDGDSLLKSRYDSDFGKLSYYQYLDEKITSFKPSRQGIYAGETGFEMSQEGSVIFVIQSRQQYQLNIDGKSVLRHTWHDELQTGLKAVRVHLDAGRHVVRLRVGTRADSNASVRVWATMPAASDAETVYFKEAERPDTMVSADLKSVYPVDLRMLIPELDGMIPDDSLHVWLGALMAIIQDDYQTAGKLLDNRIRQNPNDMMARYLAGLRYSKDSGMESSLRSEYALQQFEKVSENAPEFAYVQLLLITELIKHHQNKEALSVYQANADRLPESAEVAGILNDLSNELEWPDVAERYLYTASLLAPESCALAASALDMQYNKNNYINYESLSPVIQRCSSVINFYLEHGGQSLQKSDVWQKALNEYQLNYPDNISMKRMIWLSHLEDEPVKMTDAYLDSMRCTEQLYCEEPQRSQMNVWMDRLIASGNDKEAARLFEYMISMYPADESFNISGWLEHGIDPFKDLRIDGMKVIEDYRNQNRADAGSAVYVLDYAAVRILPNGGQVSLTHQITRVLTKEGKDGQGEVYLPDNASVLKIRTIKGDTLNIIEPEIIDYKNSITAPNLEVGDYIEVEYLTWHEPAQLHKDQVILDGFFFGTADLPMVLSKYVFEYPKDWKVDVVKNGPFDKVDYSCSPASEYMRCTAFIKNGAVYTKEPQQNSVMDVIPNILVTHNSSWDSIRRDLYESLTKVTVPTPYIKDYFHNLNLPETDSVYDKAKAIYMYVMDNIEESDSGTIDSASNTVTRGVGSRLSLLKALYDEAGISSTLVLIKSVLAPKHISEMPHLYTAGYEVGLMAETEKGPAYMFPSDDFVPFDYLPLAFSQNEVIPADTRKDVFTSRKVDAESVRGNIDITITINEDGSAYSEANENMKGHRAIEFRNFLNVVKNDSERANMIIENSLASSYGRVSLKDFKYDNFKETDNPLHLNYKFDIASMATPADDMLEVKSKMFAYRLVQSYASLSPDERKNAVVVDGTKLGLRKLKLKLPDGYHWNMDTLKDARLETRFGKYHRTVHEANGVLELEEGIIVLPQIVEKKDYAAFREFCLSVDDLQRMFLQAYRN